MLKLVRNIMMTLEKASVGSLLITGVILATSVPALAQSYKAKCKDPIEGDLDSCHVVVENNSLHLKFKESELNQTIDLSRINNLQTTDLKVMDFWTLETKLRKVFAISWHDGSRSHITSFRLKPEDFIELMLFLETKTGRSFDNEINNTAQTMDKIAADNQLRNDQRFFYESLLDRSLCTK